MTNRVSVTDLRNCLTQVVDQVEGGDNVVIHRRGREVARIVGLERGETTMPNDVRSFHLVSQQRIGKRPSLPSVDERRIRVELLIEEINEYMEGENNDDIIEIADGIADSIYILLGTAVSYGIPMQKIWDEVHRTNMAKSVNGRCEYNGHKIVKPEGWTPPRVDEIIEEAGSG